MKQTYIGKQCFTGTEILSPFYMQVENGVIQAIGSGNPPEGILSSMDPIVLKGELVTPGWIDAHCHIVKGKDDLGNRVDLESPARLAETLIRSGKNAEAMLKAGVVAIRDLGSTHGYALGVRDAIRAGVIMGPEIVASGQALCATGGHGFTISIEADGPLAMKKAARQVIKNGADCVKIMVSGGVNSPGPEPAPAELTLDEIQAATDAAHALGRKVAVHTHGNTAIRRCVEAGVDSIEHGVFLTEDLMELMAEKGIALVPTLSAPYYAVNEGLKAEPDNPDHAKSKEVLKRHRNAVITAHKKGVMVAFGTDAGTPFNSYENVAYELVLMVKKAGFTPIDALTCATVNSAKLLGIDDHLGQLAPGMEASFLVFAGNPLESIESVVEEKEIYCKGVRI
jgi:imidazolonepropionase-like amidohydrolase